MKKCFFLFFIMSSMAGITQASSTKVFKRGLTLLPTSIDPIEFDDAWSMQIALQVYARLFIVDNEGRTVPKLVSSYKSENNHTDHYICIKQNQKFSDGSNITSNDVIYSLTRSATPSLNKMTSYYFNRIAGYKRCLEFKKNDICPYLTIKKKDKNCVYIKTLSPVPNLPKILSTTVSSILKKGKPPNIKNFAKNIYSGHYIISNYSPNRVILKQNPFSNLGKEKFERIEYHIENEDKSFDLFLKGERNFARIPTKHHQEKLPSRFKEQVRSRITTTNYFFLLPNSLDQKDKAIIVENLCKSISNKLLKEIYGNTEQKSDSIFPTRLFFNPMLDDSLNICSYVKSLNNSRNKLTKSVQLLVADVMSGSKELIQKLSNDPLLKDSGIIIKRSDFGTIFSQYLSRDIKDIILMGFVPGYLDLEYYIKEWFSIDSSSRLVSKKIKIQKYVDAFSDSLDRNIRFKNLRAIIKQTNRELYYVPLMEEVVTYLVDPNTNLTISHWGDYLMLLDEVTIKDEK